MLLFVLLLVCIFFCVGDSIVAYVIVDVVYAVVDTDYVVIIARVVVVYDVCGCGVVICVFVVGSCVVVLLCYWYCR